MKIAVCFSGQMRSGVQASPSMLRYIDNLKSDCDFFVHTWDSQSHPQHASEFTKIDHKVFHDFYKIYNPVTMTVEPYEPKRAPAGTWGGYRVDPQTGRKTVSMFESIYKANRLKQQFETDNSFTYDYVIRARTDLIFHEDKSLSADINELAERLMQTRHADTFLVAFHQGHHAKLEDIFWIAPSQSMDKLCDFHAVRTASGREDDWQWHMAEWVRNELKIPFYPMLDSRIKLMRMDNSHVDPFSFTSFDVK